MGEWKIVLTSDMINEAEGDWITAALLSLLRNEQETNYDTKNYVDDDGIAWFRMSTSLIMKKLHGASRKQIQTRVQYLVDKGFIEVCKNWETSFDHSRLIHCYKRSNRLVQKEQSAAPKGSNDYKKNYKEEPLRTTIKNKGDFDFEFLPEEFNHPDFKNVWLRWLKYRKDLRLKKYAAPEITFKKLLNLSGGNHINAIAIIAQSMSNNWQGLFALKDEAKKITNPETPNYDEW